jgi:hypothetical protein
MMKKKADELFCAKGGKGSKKRTKISLLPEED